jgi:uncharacterized protein (TIGR03435 family)
MRSKSAVSLEHADDGVRIRLDSGSVIVNAAKEHAGRHLYVQTKDMTVSVVGTVFLVNAEEEGSRVGVIEGEVRVRDGASEKKLRSGDQVTTNPMMESLPLKDEVAWSRQAEAHAASLQLVMTTLLQQTSIARQAEEPIDAFEVASIRPSSLPPSGGRGGPTGRGSVGSPCTGPLIPLRVELDPRRFAAYSASLRALTQAAYGKGCFLLSGGPDWVASDRYDVEAVIPAGYGSYTAQQFRNGEAPSIQRMLQSLLANRFKLSLRREMKDMEVYNLVVIVPGKMQPASDQARPGSAVRPIPTIDARLDTAVFAEMLARLLGRPVIDKTDLKGFFDVHLEWLPAEPPVPGVTPGPPSGDSSSIFRALQDQLGLRLEPARALVETLVIDRAERPTEN